MAEFDRKNGYTKTIEVPTTFVITINDDEARDLIQDLNRIAGRSATTEDLATFLGSRNL